MAFIKAAHEQRINSIKRRKGPMTVLCPNTKTGLKWLLLTEKEKMNI